MSSFYPYLISSLPMLHFGIRPPFSWVKFLQKCQELMPQRDFQVLSSLPKTEDAVPEDITRPVIKSWISFDTALRNELVKIRCRLRHRDPLAYLRASSYWALDIAHLALAAHRAPSILEAERLIDQARWNILEELAAGHYFDLDFLIVYGYKLLILERWERISIADKEKLLEEALQE